MVTIGSFDGMHQGHQAVIRRVVELAKKEQSFSWWCSISIHASARARLTRKTVDRSRRRA